MDSETHKDLVGMGMIHYPNGLKKYDPTAGIEPTILDGASPELIALVRELAKNEPYMALAVDGEVRPACGYCMSSWYAGKPAKVPIWKEHPEYCPYRRLKEALEAHDE